MDAIEILYDDDDDDDDDFGEYIRSTTAV